MRILVTAILLASILIAGNSVAEEIVAYDFKVVAVYPHDRSAFTQGLLIREGEP